jgi:hypothetical protein
MERLIVQRCAYAVKTSDIAINAFPLPLQGPGIMITTQLTGCCIVMVPGLGTWSVARLERTGEDGLLLRKRLPAIGSKVYAATDHEGGRGALVGVRIGSKWDFPSETGYELQRDEHKEVINILGLCSRRFWKNTVRARNPLLSSERPFKDE